MKIKTRFLQQGGQMAPEAGTPAPAPEQQAAPAGAAGPVTRRAGNRGTETRRLCP